MIYNLGHAVFEFIESRWGKEGLRQYLFSLRKAVIGGGEDAYEEAFKHHRRGVRPAVRQVPEGSLQAVPRQGAAGRLRPQPRARSARRRASPTRYSVEPSPSGDLHRHRHRQPHATARCDIVLVSAKDGIGHPQPDAAASTRTRASSSSSSPAAAATRCRGCRGRRPATASPTSSAREKSRTLILQNVLNARHRAAARPADGRRSGVARHLARRPAASRSRRCRAASATSSSSTCRPSEVTNVTKDDFADSGPTWSPDGRSLIYLARVSGNEKLFRLDLATGQKTQLTFGTHDDARGAVPRRRHARLLVDGHRPGAADRSGRRAQRQHLQHLDAEPEERRAAAVHRRARRQHVDRRAARTAPPARRSPSSATTRASTSCTRSTGASRSSPRRRPTSARPGRSSTSRRRCRTRWSPRTSGRRARSRRCSSTAGRR